MISVNSSNIASVGYNEMEHILFVSFIKGGTYRYYDVPKRVYEEMLHASSVGLYFKENIKYKYRYDR